MASESGPTQTTDGRETTSRWTRRPGLARAARVLFALAPLLLSLTFSITMSMLAPPSRIGVNRWIWIVGLAGISVLLLARIDRVVRRVAPLAGLLQLSLVFPDEAPNRYKAAKRSFSARKVQGRIDAMRDAGYTLGDAQNRSQTMLDLIAMISEHDRMTRGHSERVRAYAEMIGRELNLSEADLDKLQWASLLHDLGKLTVPSQILNKDGKPDEAEWQILRGHPAAGIPLAAPIADWLGEWTSAIGQHHERWDGNGYPDGFSGNDLPLAARIVAIADAYDVMTSSRSYKKSFSAEVARREIAKGAGSQFCPTVARAFLAVPASRLRAIAGPLSWLGGIPGLQNVPIVEVLTSSTMVAATATATAVTAISIIPALVPVLASAQESAATPTSVSTTLPATSGSTTSAAVVPEDPSDLVISIPTVGSTIATTNTGDSPPTQPAAVTTTASPGPTNSSTPSGSGGPTTTALSGATTTGVDSSTSTTVAPTTTVTTTTTGPGSNTPPTAVDDTTSVLEGAAVTFNVIANDFDPDNGDNITVIALTQPLQGIATNNGDGTIGYSHDGSETTTDTMTYTIADAAGSQSTATITIGVTPQNDTPTAFADNRTTGINTPIVIDVATLVSNDTDAEDGAGFGQSTVTLAAPNPPGATVIQPGGAGTDITFTPNTGQTSTQIFGYRVCDVGGLCATATVSVDIDASFGILISEFSTADAYSQGNFIELYNASPGPIDISGWQLRIADGNGTAGTWANTVLIAGPNTLVASGGYYLIGDVNDPIAATSDQTVNAEFDADFGVGLHDGSNYVDIVGNRAQLEQGSVAAATLVDGVGVSPLKALPGYELSYRRLGTNGVGRCADSDNNQFDWTRVTDPNPLASSAPTDTCAPPPAGPQANSLVISELRTDGPFSGTNDFVELFNPTSATIQLSGLQLRRGGVSFLTLSTFALQPGQRYLVGGSGYAGPTDQTYTSGGPDSSSVIEIWNPSPGQVVDDVDIDQSASGLPMLAQRLADTYERNDGGCTDTNVWIDDFSFRMTTTPQTSADPFTPCS